MKLTALLLLNFIFFAATAQENIPSGIYDFKIEAHDGSVIDLSQYKGHKILIVNVTAYDEFNRQYPQLEALSQKYTDGLVVIGMLTDDFLAPATINGQKSVAGKNYDVSFPLAEMVKVKGAEMAPIYKWLTQKKYNKVKDTEVRWDFQKYLINEKGELTAVFDPKVTASDPKLIAAIEQ